MNQQVPDLVETVICQECRRELTTVSPYFGHWFGCRELNRKDYWQGVLDGKGSNATDLTPQLEESIRRVQQDKSGGRASDLFFSLIEDSLGAHAKRKGYSDNGMDGENILYKFTTAIGASAGHSLGEVIYKCVEYIKHPREVLLIKIASWALLEWKYGNYEKLP